MPGVKQDATVEDILAVVAREKNAVERGDIFEYFSILAEDAKFLPPNSLPKEGSELRTWLNDFLESYSIRWLNFESHEVIINKDLAYHSYYYKWSATSKSGGQTNISSGKGLHIFRLQQDGSWRIYTEIWNLNPAE